MTTDAARPARWRAVLVLLAAFALGVVCGAAAFRIGASALGPGGTRWMPPRPPLEHLARTLDLDDRQRREIRALLREQRVRMHELLEESREEIRAVLRPEQREHFDRMRPEAGRRGDRPGRRGRGGGPPPQGPPPPGDPDPPPPEEPPD